MIRKKGKTYFGIYIQLWSHLEVSFSNKKSVDVKTVNGDKYQVYYILWTFIKDRLGQKLL